MEAEENHLLSNFTNMMFFTSMMLFAWEETKSRLHYLSKQITSTLI